MRTLRNSIFLLALLAPAFAYAQFLPEPIQYVVSPEVPGPNQQVTIEVQGVGTFIGDAQITWQQDGKTTKSGVGERSYTFVTGALGSATSVHVSIQSSTNGSFSKDFVFRPSAVNLVWEADTSAPPLYRGKPLYSAGSALKIVAFPTVVINGSRVAAQSLSYQWSRGDQALPGQSGLGRSALSISGDQLQASEDITVDVYFGALLVARGGVSVLATTPELLLYERDSLRGLLTDYALPSSIALVNKEITIAAQPYFFSNAALKSGALQYAWTLNGNEIAGPDSARGVLTLRQTGSGQGGATLSVSLQNNNQDQLVQAADTLLQIIFGASGSGSSLFGI
jgi:hypothetical protein